MNRRRFVTFSASSIAAAALGACDSFGPKRATSLLRLAERKNEGFERWLFSPDSRNGVATYARLCGRALPRFFV